MRTPTVLCLLLSLAVGSSSAQVPPSAGSWRVDSAAQRERDKIRKSILEDELASEAKQFVVAHSELREARARRVQRSAVDDIAERLDRHRRNLGELGREIARVEGQTDVAVDGEPKRAAERLADNWLIPGPSRDERGRPEWIIPPGQPGRLQ